MENECNFCCDERIKRIGYTISPNQKWIMILRKIDDAFVLMIEKDGSCKEFGKKINFCPFCGRKLIDEEENQNE